MLTPSELPPEHSQLLCLCMQCHTVTNKLPRSCANPACCTYSSHQNKNSASAILSFAYLQNAFSGLWPVWHGEGWAAALLSWAFLSADFCYRITSWQNNAWQELIKDCNMNPCRAHWGKFVIGTVFLCLHEQKLGLTVSLISSFGSVWTLCYSVLLFLHFSLW